MSVNREDGDLPRGVSDEGGQACGADSFAQREAHGNPREHPPFRPQPTGPSRVHSPFPVKTPKRDPYNCGNRTFQLVAKSSGVGVFALVDGVLGGLNRNRSHRRSNGRLRLGSGLARRLSRMS
jgi:hypothetical protein